MSGFHIHSWSPWKDMRTVEFVSTRDASQAKVYGLPPPAGQIVITQERRCPHCNKLQLREVKSRG